MTDEPDTTDGSDTSASSSPADSWRRLALLLAGALVVALAGVAYLWSDRDDAPADASGGGSSASGTDLTRAGSDAEEAARAAVVRMTTYDWRTVDQDFTWVDEAGTEKFKSQFTGASTEAKKVVTGLKAAAKGTVVDSAPKVVDATHVTVLLFVDQEITAAEQDGTKIDQPRVTMKMLLDGGRWLVDEVELSNLVGE